MRRILLASCIALLPGLALAQSTTNDQTPPPPPPTGEDFGPSPDMMGQSGMMGGWGKERHGFGGEDMLVKFYSANTTHDGHLTLEQAKAAGLNPVADHFSDIDVKKHGYVTFYDIEAWRLDDIAKRLEQRADDLRGKD